MGPSSQKAKRELDTSSHKTKRTKVDQPTDFIYKESQGNGAYNLLCAVNNALQGCFLNFTHASYLIKDDDKDVVNDEHDEDQEDEEDDEDDEDDEDNEDEEDSEDDEDDEDDEKNEENEDDEDDEGDFGGFDFTLFMKGLAYFHPKCELKEYFTLLQQTEDWKTFKTGYTGEDGERVGYDLVLIQVPVKCENREDSEIHFFVVRKFGDHWVCLDSLPSCDPCIISNIREFLFDESKERVFEHLDKVFKSVNYRQVLIYAVKANVGELTYSGEGETHIEIAKSARPLPTRFYNTYSLARLPST